jgi:hypothetical protein
MFMPILTVGVRAFEKFFFFKLVQESSWFWVALGININIDGAPIASKSHTHPSHSQTSRLLTSSLF